MERVIFIIQDSDDTAYAYLNDVLQLVGVYPSIDWEIWDVATQAGYDLAESLGIGPGVYFPDSTQFTSYVEVATVEAEIKKYVPLEVFYIAPLNADTDKLFLEDDAGNAAEIPLTFWSNWKDEKVYFYSNVGIDQASVRLTRGGRELDSFNVSYSIASYNQVVAAIENAGVERDKEQIDVLQDVNTNKKNNSWWLLLLLLALMSRE